MSAVNRSFLQTEIFDKEKELIFSIISFKSNEKPTKGTKQNILVLAARTFEPFSPTLYLIRLKQKNKIKRQHGIPLSEVSNIYAKQDLHIQFMLKGRNPLTVGCTSRADQTEFMDSLWQASQSFLTVRPTFHGYNPNRKAIPTQPVKKEEDPEKLKEASRLAEKRMFEERQLLNLLRRFHYVIFSVEFLIQKLEDSNEDSVWTILEAVVESERGSTAMNQHMDECLKYLDQFEDILNISEMSILDLGTQIKELEMVDADREFKIKNQELLLNELVRLVSAFDLSDDVLSYIDNGNVALDKQKTSSIVEGLSSSLLTPVDDVVKLIPSIRLQIDMVFDKSANFVSLLAVYLQTEIRAYESNFLKMEAQKEMATSNHFIFHKKLKSILPDIDGLKILNATLFTDTYTCYCNSFGKIYEKQVRDLVNVCISQITTTISSKAGSSAVKQHKDIVIHKFDDAAKVYMEECKMLIQQFFDLVEEIILKDVRFAIDFLLSTRKSIDEKKVKQAPTDFSQRLNLKIKTMISNCFCFLEKELRRLYDWAIKTVPILVVYMYHKSYLLKLRSDQYVYMTQTYHQWINISTGYVNTFFNGVKSLISNFKVSKKVDNMAITNGVRAFEDLIHISDMFLKGSDKHCKELEANFTRALSQLYEHMYKQVKDGETSFKTEAIILENNFFIDTLMLGTKSKLLSVHKKTTRNRYKKSIEQFVRLSLRDPFEAIRNYFEAIEASIKKGIKADEIHIQSIHSLSQLAKVVENYSLKEIKKIIEGCTKSIGKHFGQSNLILVIWTSFYDEIKTMFKHYLDLYVRCYPKDNNVWTLKIEEVAKILDEVNIKYK